jgi:hypothetical protein
VESKQNFLKEGQRLKGIRTNQNQTKEKEGFKLRSHFGLYAFPVDVLSFDRLRVVSEVEPLTVPALRLLPKVGCRRKQRRREQGKTAPTGNKRRVKPTSFGTPAFNRAFS